MRSLTRNDIRQEVLYFASCNVALSKSVTERPYRRNHGTRISWTSESRVKRSQGVERMNVAVVGAGIFGMAAAIELGERGHSVTVYEQGTVPHPKATSTDVSKVIRRTWYAGDNETYVELVERAAAKWREWEALLGSPIYHVTGALKVLPGLEPGTPMYESLSYLKGRGAEVSLLSLDEVRTRFPQFVVRKGETFVYDPWQGYLESGRAVAGLAELARRSGIEINQDTPVQTIDESDGGVALDLQAGAARFDRVVVAAGVWVARLLPEIGKHVRVTHQEMVLIEVDRPEMFSVGTFPIWSVDPDGEGWYGFPLLREGYVKIAKEPPGEVVDPDIDRKGTPEFAELTLDFLRERIPEMARGRLVDGKICLYAETPDDHFLVDWLPGSSRILVAGGGSGHGFKFGGSIGPVIADALEDRPNALGELFRIGSRFEPEVASEPRQWRGFAFGGRGG